VRLHTQTPLTQERHHASRDRPPRGYWEKTVWFETMCLDTSESADKSTACREAGHEVRAACAGGHLSVTRFDLREQDLQKSSARSGREWCPSAALDDGGMRAAVDASCQKRIRTEVNRWPMRRRRLWMAKKPDG
jgi:hypothetical protein